MDAQGFFSIRMDNLRFQRTSPDSYRLLDIPKVSLSWRFQSIPKDCKRFQWIPKHSYGFSRNDSLIACINWSCNAVLDLWGEPSFDCIHAWILSPLSVLQVVDPRHSICRRPMHSRLGFHAHCTIWFQTGDVHVRAELGPMVVPGRKVTKAIASHGFSWRPEVVPMVVPRSNATKAIASHALPWTPELATMMVLNPIVTRAIASCGLPGLQSLCQWWLAARKLSKPSLPPASWPCAAAKAVASHGFPWPPELVPMWSAAR